MRDVKLERGYQSNSKTNRYRLRRLLGNGRVVATPPQVHPMWTIGCCDNSPNQHASKHNASTGHAIITSLEHGENWFYDYRTGDLFAGPKLPGPFAHPLDQPVPGPAGRVPAE